MPITQERFLAVLDEFEALWTFTTETLSTLKSLSRTSAAYEVSQFLSELHLPTREHFVIEREHFRKNLVKNLKSRTRIERYRMRIAEGQPTAPPRTTIERTIAHLVGQTHEPTVIAHEVELPKDMQETPHQLPPGVHIAPDPTIATALAPDDDLGLTDDDHKEPLP